MIDKFYFYSAQAYASGRMVYFDLFGYIFISYSESSGQLLHFGVSIASILLTYYILHTKGISRRYVRKEILFGFFVTLVSFCLAIFVCYLIASELDLNGKSMSWYNRTYFSIILYCFPSAVIASLFYAQLTRTRDSPLSLGLQTQARLGGVNTVWALLCFALNLFKYRTAYVLMVPVLITLVVNVSIWLTRSQNTSEFFF